MKDIEVRKLGEDSFDGFADLVNDMNVWAEHDEFTGEQKQKLISDYASGKFEAMVAYCDDKVVGFVSFFQTYATMDANESMYVEDIFVDEEYRDEGVGRALIEKCLEIAKERGYHRVDLLSFGEGPRKFYEKLGAKYKGNNYHYRFVL